MIQDILIHGMIVLMLPLKHCTTLRQRVSQFQSALLPTPNKDNASTASIPGLDSSIMVDPVRLHLTLGVMNLVDDTASNTSSSSPSGSGQSQTVSAALTLLQSLRPKLQEITLSSGTAVTLDRMGIFTASSDRVRSNARVLWIGPNEEQKANPSKEWKILWDVCGQYFEHLLINSLDRRQLS
jgi:activating signal cointegrator complex subunit 1